MSDRRLSRWGTSWSASAFRFCVAPLAVAGLVSAGAAISNPAAAGVEVLGEAQDRPSSLVEVPALKDRVAGGDLPPIERRLPDHPLVVGESDARAIGSYGGSMRMLVGRAKDTRLLVVYGYARLVCFNEDLELVADIAEKVEVEDGRIFTFTLRKGHKWSDGAPFTTEDLRYYWEDVANNEELSPSGPPKVLLVDGEPARVEVIDEVTIRYSWSKPNPYFLAALAGARPLFIYRPSHYLKPLHIEYGDKAEIEDMVAKKKVRNWASLHNRLDNLYRFDNPDLPTLQPWMNTVAPPSQRFIAKRNPYYHRVDSEGHQLPYIDEVKLDVVNSTLIAAKVGAGDADLQSRGLNFSDYTFLKSEEERNGYAVRLWPTVRGSRFALYPNLNVNDPAWRKLFRDIRFRKALSHAVHRDEINQLIYYGLGLNGNHSILPDSPLFEPHYRETAMDFDLEKANALLDELGLTERDGDGIRLLPDGRPLRIIVETAGESTEEVDILELIHDSWKQAGIKLFTKPSQREVLRNRIFTGDTLMAMWFGYENGVPTADMSPAEFAPTQQHSYHWPKWGQYYETGGQSGEPIDMAEAKKLMEIYERWSTATDRETREAAWHEILEIHAEQVYTIGIVAQVPQPIVVSNRMRNVPEEAIYNWNPGAQFGMYRPDSFWIAGARTE